MAAPFWVLLASVALTSTGIGRYIYLNNNRYDMHMASYWTSEDSATSFRYMSVYARGARPGGSDTPALYINQSTSLSRSDIVTMRTSLQNLADSGRSSAGKSGLGTDGRPVGWEDCFCSYLTASIDTVADPGDPQAFTFNSTTDVIAVEGNFLAFHPFSFLSGGFLPEIAEDARQIVVNDVLAWKFYKSYDVLGEKLMLWGQEFTIIGVVTEPTDKIARTTGTNEPRVYVYFSAMEQWAPLVSTDNTTNSNNGTPGQNGSSGATQYNNSQPVATGNASAGAAGAAGSGTGTTPAVRPDMAIMCYEAMLPEAVKNVAKTDMSSSVPNYTPATPNFYVVSNTGRFSVYNTWHFMWPIGQTQTRLAQYDFPYWEKCAQLTSQHLFADVLLTSLGAILLVTGTIMAALRYRRNVSKMK